MIDHIFCFVHPQWHLFFVTCPSAPCSNISVLSKPTLALHFSSQYLLPLCCYCDPFGMTFELTIWYLVFWNVHSLTYKSSLKGRNPTTFLSDSMKEKLPFWQAPLNSPRVRLPQDKDGGDNVPSHPHCPVFADFSACDSPSHYQHWEELSEATDVLCKQVPPV